MYSYMYTKSMHKYGSTKYSQFGLLVDRLPALLFGHLCAPQLVEVDVLDARAAARALAR